MHLPLATLSAGATTLLVVYLALGVLLFVYGSHAYLMTWLHHRLGRRATPPRAAEGEAWPRVTVQLPLYNELYVVRRLVDAVCAFDYPRERLEIQLLDDSTDETAAAVARLVAEKRALGFDIAQVRRARRVGYKGGALREGLAVATGEFLAVFDADFEPPADFLRRTIPHFADPGLGMVQARWGHLNEEYSLLTRAQAVALDGHFLVEQTARNRSGAFINFNGTAGIWRRAAIQAAGDWQDDTLTEDLDLSYRAQLAGWRFLFLPDLVCPAELPVEVNGFKGQQFRWAKGSAQTALKLLPRLWRAPHRLFVKLQATIHLTNHCVYPLLVAVALISLPALRLYTGEAAARPAFDWATLLVVASLGHPLLYLYAQSRLRRDWLRQLPMIPVMIALGMGIALNNTRALLEAAAGVRSGFNRTPKYDLRARGDRWQTKKYRVPLSVGVAAELALGLYLAVSAAYSVRHGLWAVAPFLALYAAGLLYVGGLSLGHALARPAGQDDGVAPVEAAA